MDDLIAFLRARLDEDDRAARAAEPGPWTAFGDPGQGVTVGPEDFGIATDYTGQNRSSYEHIARHDPVRVLAEVAAKRQIIDEGIDVNPSAMLLAEFTLRYLALPYTDHPDYREEWRP